MTKAKISLLLLFLSYSLLSSQTTDGLSINLLIPEKGSFSMNKSLYYYEDTEDNLTLEDLTKPEFDSRFVLSTKNKVNFGHTHSAYWVKFHMKNTDPSVNDWLFEINYPLLDSIEFYYRDIDNQWKMKPFGDMYPFAQREWDYQSFVISLDLPDTETHTYYMKLKSKGGMQFPMNIYRVKSFNRLSNLSETYYGLFFGIMLLLIIYNTFIYFSLKDKSYLHYILLILSCIIFLAFMSGHMFQYVLQNSVWWCNKLLPPAIALCEFCIILFTMSFLNTKEQHPKLHGFLRFVLALAFAMIFLLFITDYRFAAKVTSYTALLYIFVSLVSGIIAWFRGNKAAGLFTLAFTIFVLGVIAISLRAIGVVSDNLVSRHGMELGAMVNGVILSLALINSYRISRIETEQANAEIIEMRRKANLELERKVKERMMEIQEKNELLENQKQELEMTLFNLTQTQKQLIQSEKMAALGGLVAGVAHEINTPVGISVTAASTLSEETNRLADLYGKDKISRMDFKDFLNMANQTTGLILSNMERTASMIQSFKQVSADQSTAQQRRFELKAYTQDVIQSLYPRLKDHKVSINLNINESLELDSFPGAFSQIITNFVLNSLSYAFDEKDKGTIEISAEFHEDDLRIKYSDSGKGMSNEVREKIFEPFFSTDKNLGKGLGMHIVYNLVTQKLDGTIECQSEPGKGTSFIIELPGRIAWKKSSN